MSTWRPSGTSRAEQDPKPVAESLDRISRRLGAPRSGVMTAVFSGWEGLVGAEIASHARPLSLRSGVLVLSADEPAWASQLRFMATELIARIHEATGLSDIREIQVRVSGVSR